MNLLFKISYGLYVLSAEADGVYGGCMINTLSQQTSAPEKFSVTVNKANFTHELIRKSGKFAVAVLSRSTSFELIKGFGMRSGKDADKFEGVPFVTAENGCKVPTEGVLGYFEMAVEDSIDFGSHTMFVAKRTDTVALAEDGEELTYAYYQSDIKPRPAPLPAANDGEEVWVCKVCGYVHRGKLPADFVCPICKHGAQDFERVDKKPDDGNAAATIKETTQLKEKKLWQNLFVRFAVMSTKATSPPRSAPSARHPRRSSSSRSKARECGLQSTSSASRKALPPTSSKGSRPTSRASAPRSVCTSQ